MGNYRATILAMAVMIFATILIPNKSNAGSTQDFIAVVDIKKIMQGSLAAENIREQIKEERDRYISEITKKEDKLRKEDKKLSEQRSTLSPEEFKEKRNNFKENMIKEQRDAQIKISQLDKTYNDSVSKVQKEISNIIAKIAKENRFRIVLPTSVILFADDSMNITTEVIQKLNKNLPKVNINLDK